MANTTKKTTTTQTKAELVDELNKAKNENTEMANMLKQMQEQMAMLQAQINMQAMNNNQVVIKQNDDITRTVRVVCLLPYTFSLTTRKYGVGGKVYTFEKYGEFKDIKFTDMQDIINLFEHRFEEGWVVLTNKKDYDDLGLGHIYDSVRNKDTLDRLTSLEYDDCIDTILNMNEEMQDIIIRLIAKRIANGENLNYNRIRDLEDNGFEINTLVDLLRAE